MIRVLALLVRRPDWTRSAFAGHYERVHAPLGMSVLGDIPHYRRNHVVRSLAGPEPCFDVLSEFGYADVDAMGTMARRLASAEQGDPIRRDELRFMDKPRNVFFPIEPAASVVRPGRSSGEGAALVVLGRAAEGEDREAHAGRIAAALVDMAAKDASVVAFRTVDSGQPAPWDAVAFVQTPPGRPVAALPEFAPSMLQLEVRVCATRTSAGWGRHD